MFSTVPTLIQEKTLHWILVPLVSTNFMILHGIISKVGLTVTGAIGGNTESTHDPRGSQVQGSGQQVSDRQEPD